MNTKILMTISAVFLGIMGILFSFSPQEILNYLTGDSNLITLLFLQILGSLYLGFGILNWMTKSNLIGGIYSKPLAIGNLAHFGVSAIALLKINFKAQAHVAILILLAVVYTVFTICFAYVFLKNPKKVG